MTATKMEHLFLEYIEMGSSNGRSKVLEFKIAEVLIRFVVLGVLWRSCFKSDFSYFRERVRISELVLTLAQAIVMEVGGDPSQATAIELGGDHFQVNEVERGAAARGDLSPTMDKQFDQVSKNYIFLLHQTLSYVEEVGILLQAGVPERKN